MTVGNHGSKINNKLLVRNIDRQYHPVTLPSCHPITLPFTKVVYTVSIAASEIRQLLDGHTIWLWHYLHADWQWGQSRAWH